MKYLSKQKRFSLILTCLSSLKVGRKLLKVWSTRSVYFCFCCYKYFSVILLSWTTFDIKDNILDRLFVQDSETSSGVIFVVIIRHDKF